MFRKLHLKLTAYMGIILILFMFFVSAGIYKFTKIVFDDGNKELMRAEAQRIYNYKNTTYAEYFFNGTLFRKFIQKEPMDTKRLDACFIVYDSKLRPVISDEDEITIGDDIKSLAQKSLEEKQDIYTTKKIGRFNYRIYTKYFNDFTGQSVVQVYQNTVNEDILWSFLRTVLIMIGISGTLILLLLSYILTGKALTPIRETWKRQREFVADASHELRTPLTVIQTNLDVVLSDEDGTVDENEIWIDNAYSETRVMAKLIDQLLILAKADNNEEKLDISEFSFSEVVENVCQTMEVIAVKKNIELITNIEDNIIIKADYDKIRRLAVILIDNAVKYTEKGKVTVSLKTDKNKKILIVEDTGIGINEKDLDRIFDRFYRADKARHREGGTGLGLSIAKWIADKHKYSLTAESTVNEGSKFTLKI
ncbi:MAG: HAMP domain-containing sensor histidine kinase [Tissierellia bacterium]|jgi:signal transduction histidine kinase|nr:HAMP domain-containing sensor histidine kinase [Tissierellia bacterium]MDD3226309.1 HAMP domain-containing sensor histidine kinase [Tissierellia bacterium]MDD3751518.1 HAMP domain-containing sensor histidine kinase [Tissierellia bacterium]MDD4045890.1 HAMP domain-containing sensor histidine kinase [Tissierellia bacterium]MDD4678084.1 HAMP domain-containing sensor histidine kinase [Tissierellia bacterium]